MQTDNTIHISIIIPHYNNTDKLQKCLDALFVHYDQRSDIEIIVVDNGSTADLSKLQKRFAVKWLEETSHLSPYACRNTGIKAALGELIVLLDSNCIPMSGWLESGLAALSNKRSICAAQLQHLSSDSVFPTFDLLYSVIRPEDMPQRQSLPAGNLFLYKSAFDELGLFSQHTRSLGDIQWTHKAYKAGYQLCLTADEVAQYHVKEKKAFIRKMIRLGGGKKEQFLANGGSTKSLFWMLEVVKKIFPPHPRFVKRMNELNRRENTKLKLFQVFLLCWLTKVLRGYGMLTTKYKG